MALAAITRTVQDGSGNAVAGASVEIRAEIAGAPLVALYSDRAGLTPIGNPYTAPAAQFTVYLAEAVVRIDVTASGASSTERYAVAIEDVPGEPTLQITEVTAAGPYNMTAADDVILINQTVGAPMTVNLLTSVGRTRPIKIVDKKGDASTNAITIDANGTETIIGQLTYPINFDFGSVTLNPDQAGGWYI
jgi:hypothetical protein